MFKCWEAELRSTHMIMGRIDGIILTEKRQCTGLLSTRLGTTSDSKQNRQANEGIAMTPQ